jgi:hypothetical protein
MEGGFIGELIGDTSYVYAKVRSFLNTYKIESGKFPSEESVRKEMEERIRVDMEEEIKRELEEEK